MEKNEVKKLLPIITAFANGKKIEYLYKDGIWREQNNLSFCNLANRYRIKQEPEYVPFTFEDAEQLIGKAIKHKGDNGYSIIIGVFNKHVAITHTTISFEDLFKTSLFLDGSPCGKIKE